MIKCGLQESDNVAVSYALGQTKISFLYGGDAGYVEGITNYKEVAKAIYDELLITVSKDDEGLTSLAPKLIEKSLLKKSKRKMSSEEIQRFIEPFINLVQSSKNVDPVTEAEIAGKLTDPTAQDDPNAEITDLSQKPDEVKTWAITANELIRDYMKHSNQYFLQLNQKFKRDFYTDIFIDAYKGKAYIGDQETLTDRIGEFKATIQQRLSENPSAVAAIENAQGKELSTLLEDPHTKEVYLDYMMDRFMPTLINFNWGKAIKYNSKEDAYSFNMKTNSRKDHKNDGVGDGFATLGGVTRLHINATPLIRRVGETSQFEVVKGKFLSEGAIKKLIERINKDNMVNKDEHSFNLHTNYLKNIAGAIHEYAIATDDPVAWSAYHKFFSPSPIELNEDGATKSFYSLKAIGTSLESKEKERLNAMVVSFVGNVAQTARYHLISLEEGKLKTTQGGSATRELLKDHSDSMINDLINDVFLGNDKKMNMIKPYWITDNAVSVGRVRRQGENGSKSELVDVVLKVKQLTDFSRSTFFEALPMSEQTEISGENGGTYLSDYDYQTLLRNLGFKLDLNVINRILKSEDGSYNLEGIHKLNNILADATALMVYNRSKLTQTNNDDFESIKEAERLTQITPEVYEKLTLNQPNTLATENGLLYPSRLMRSALDILADAKDNVNDIFTVDKVLNLEGNAVATFGLATPLHKMTGKVYEIRKSNKTTVNDNNNFVKRGIYRILSWGLKDGMKSIGEKGKPTKKLTTTENAVLDIIGLFGTHLVGKDYRNASYRTAIFNFGTFSDGSSVVVPEVHAEESVTDPATGKKTPRMHDFLPVKSELVDGKTVKSLDVETLRNTYTNSVGRYYQQVGDNVVTTWKGILKSLGDELPGEFSVGINDVHSIKQLRNFFKLNKIPASYIVNMDPKHGEPVPNLEYVVKKDGTIGLRDDLVAYVEMHTPDQNGEYKTLNAYMDHQYQRYLSNLTSRKHVPFSEFETTGANMGLTIPESSQNINDGMASRFDPKWSKGNVFLNEEVNGKAVTHSNPLIEGYFWHFQAISNDIMNIMQGNVFQYKAPGETDLPDNYTFSQLDKMISSSYVDRVKRSKSMTSSYYQPTLQELNDEDGIPVDYNPEHPEDYEPNFLLGSHSNVAYFTDTSKVAKVLSLYGEKSQEVYDGAEFITPLEQILIANSYGGEFSEFNTPIIKNIQSDMDNVKGVLRFEKKAEYVISAELQRLSDGNKEFDGKKFVEWSMKVPFPNEVPEGYLTEEGAAAPKGTFINYTYTNPKGVQTDISGYYQNYFEIYEKLGGLSNAEVYHQLIDIRATHPTITNSFVGRMGIDTSVKTGMKSNNGDIATYLNKDIPLRHTKSSNKGMGIQLNPFHDPDHVDAAMTSPSQLINAIVGEGRNILEASNLYKALGTLAKHKFEKEYSKFQNDPKTFARNILKEYADRTQDDASSSTVIDKIRSGNYSFDDPQILRVAQTQVFAAIEKLAITHKFNGGQFVITPVTNIVMLHEFIDHNGVKRIMLAPHFRDHVLKLDRLGMKAEADAIRDTQKRNLNYTKYYKDDGTEATNTPEWMLLKANYDWQNKGTGDFKSIVDAHNSLFPKNQIAYTSGNELALSKQMQDRTKTAFYKMLDSPGWTTEPGELLMPMWMKKTFHLTEGDSVDEIRNTPNFFYRRLEATKFGSKLSPKVLKEMADSLKVGFEKSTKAIIARIPGSGKQSDNSARIVGFMDSLGNAVGVPYESMIVKGEDFDIDKGNIMLLEFVGKESKRKSLQGSTFPYMTNPQTGDVLTKEEFKATDPLEFEKYENAFLGTGVDWYESGVRNFIIDTIYNVGLKSKNAIEKNFPVSTDSIGNLVKNTKTETYFSPNEPMSVIMMSVINQRGKQMVGIEATAEKAFFAIYYSAMKKVINGKEQQIQDSFEPISLSPIPGFGPMTFSKVANLTNLDVLSTLTPAEMADVETALHREYEAKSLSEEAWKEYSALINAATDNAKLLYLGRLNADLDTGNYMNSLIAIGAPVKYAAAFINQPIIKEIQAIAIKQGLSFAKVLNDLRYAKDERVDDVWQVSKIAKEFQFIGKNLSINTKFTNNGEDVYLYENKIRQFLLKAEEKQGTSYFSDFSLRRFVEEGPKPGDPVGTSYQEKMIMAYDNLKTAFNPLKVFADNEHYLANMGAYAIGKDIMIGLSDTIGLANNVMDELDPQKRNEEGTYQKAAKIAERYIKMLYFNKMEHVEVKYAANEDDSESTKFYKFNLSEPDGKYGSAVTFLNDFRDFVRKLGEDHKGNYFVDNLTATSEIDPLSGMDFTVYRTMDLRNVSDSSKLMLKNAMANLPLDAQKVLFNYSLLMGTFNNVSGSFYDMLAPELHADFNEFLNSHPVKDLSGGISALNSFNLSKIITDLSLSDHVEVKEFPDVGKDNATKKIKMYDKWSRKMEYYERKLVPIPDTEAEEEWGYAKLENAGELAVVMPFKVGADGDVQLQFSVVAEDPFNDPTFGDYEDIGTRQYNGRGSNSLKGGRSSGPIPMTAQAYHAQTIANRTVEASQITKKGLFKVTPANQQDLKSTLKSELSNKYIGLSTKKSATNNYMEQIDEQTKQLIKDGKLPEGTSVTNTEHYTKDDVVFISAPGIRQNKEGMDRWNTDMTYIKLLLADAIKAKATIVKDDEHYLSTSEYNIGEKALTRELLLAHYNYSTVTMDGTTVGVWTAPKDNPLLRNINQKIEQEVNLGDPDYVEGMRLAKLRDPKTNIPQNLRGGVESEYGKVVQFASKKVEEELGFNATSIDMIISKLRTRTTRSASEMKKYNLLVGDYVMQFGTYKGENGEKITKNALTRITSIYSKSDPRFKDNWHKEGWSEDGFKHISPNLEYAIEFEVVHPENTYGSFKMNQDGKRVSVPMEDVNGKSTVSDNNEPVTFYIDDKPFVNGEHAYQSYKSANFNEGVYSDPIWAEGGIAINPEFTVTHDHRNERLLKRITEVIEKTKAEKKQEGDDEEYTIHHSEWTGNKAEGEKDYAREYQQVMDGTLDEETFREWYDYHFLEELIPPEVLFANNTPDPNQLSLDLGFDNSQTEEGKKNEQDCGN